MHEIVFPDKVYLGDGVYAKVEDRGLVLTAENGIEATDTIVLEPVVLSGLLTVIEMWRSLARHDDAHRQ